MQWAHFCVHGAILSAVYAFQLSTQIIDEEEKNRFLIDHLNHLVIIHGVGLGCCCMCTHPPEPIKRRQGLEYLSPIDIEDNFLTNCQSKGSPYRGPQWNEIKRTRTHQIFVSHLMVWVLFGLILTTVRIDAYYFLTTSERQWMVINIWQYKCRLGAKRFIITIGIWYSISATIHIIFYITDRLKQVADTRRFT